MPSTRPGAKASRPRYESSQDIYFTVRNTERRWVALHEGIKTRASWESVVERLLESSQQSIVAKLQDIQNPGLVVNLGFQRGSNLLAGHKLHLYAVAFADRLKELSGVQFSSVRLSKRLVDSTTVAVDEALETERPQVSQIATMMTRQSYAKPAFGEEVHENAESLFKILVSKVPLGLHVSYLTGFPRTWARLWQPTISGVFTDSEGEALTSAQIVDLGFDHLSIGEALRHQVQLTISATRLPDVFPVNESN